MLKQTLLSLTLCLCCCSLWAQTSSESEVGRSSALSKKGKWDFALILGSGNYINEALVDQSILLPGYDGLTDIGLSETPSLYLSSDSYNSNSITNIAGLEIGYFITENLQLTLSATATIGMTPSVDYIEGYQIGSEASMLDIPAYQYVEGRLDQRLMASIGANKYYKTGSDKVNLIVGAQCAYGLAALESYLPYTGETTESGESTAIYQSYVSGGSAQTITGAITAGVEYQISENLNFGINFAPFSYTWGLIAMCPQGYDNYYVSCSTIKVFSFPEVRFGIRF